MDFREPAETPEMRLSQAGISLPNIAPAPIGAFCNVRKSGNLLFVSGQGPVQADGTLLCGRVGDDVSAETAREHAKLVAINMLATLSEHLGDLDAVAGVVKLLGLVNSTADFARHPFVIDGASELLVEVFGPEGVHARSSFGVASLPNHITVEIEAIFELREE